MKTEKLNYEQAKVVREFTEYANELYVKYKDFTKTVSTINLRAIKDLPPSYDTLTENSYLLASNLAYIRTIKVNEENVLYYREDLIDEADFISEMLYRLYLVTRYSALIEPYTTIKIKEDIQELCFRMREIVKYII